MPPKRKQRLPASKVSAKKSKTEEVETVETVETVEIVEIVSCMSKVPVDPECNEKKNSAHVFCEGNDVWDATLNQTNLQLNNNKFYRIQLLEDNNSKNYCVWCRWGRVGKRGQSSLHLAGGNLDRAKKCFETKFRDKTRNEWSDRDTFEKVDGKYDLLKVDYKPTNEGENVPEAKLAPAVESKLERRVKELIELICNTKIMEKVVLEMKYDAKKAPLGKLTAEQIIAGYTALKTIEDIINKRDLPLRGQLIQACNDFYTRIPHNFGMKRPPVIDTLAEVTEKIRLLDALGDIQIAMKLLNENPDLSLHPADNHYNSLKCDLIPLDKSHPDYSWIEKYLKNTQGSTHNQYNLSIETVFKCEKDEEKERFLDVGNRRLLWHGSRLSNWAGILGKGLRIAPPEAPVSGYMFGKGIYFTDMCSKSANYCYPSRSMNTGLLLLCEVSLGNVNELKSSNPSADRLPKGKHSVRGIGKNVPDPEEILNLPDGVTVPCGKEHVTDFENDDGYTLNYNEYIVYDIRQVRMRYLLQVKFNFY